MAITIAGISRQPSLGFQRSFPTRQLSVRHVVSAPIRRTLPLRHTFCSTPRKYWRGVCHTAAVAAEAAGTAADDKQPASTTKLAKLLSVLRTAVVSSTCVFMASRILTGPGAVLAAYYALQVVAPALALRKAFKLSTLEAFIGSLTLVRVAWMLATRYILPPSALVKTHVTFTSSAVLPAFLQRFMDGGFYVPGNQPFGIEQIPLVDGLLAAAQAGLGALDHILVPASELFMDVITFMVGVIPALCLLWLLCTCVDTLTGHRLLRWTSNTTAGHRQQEQTADQVPVAAEGESPLEQRLRMVIRDREQHIQRLQGALQGKRRESLRCAALEREVSHDKKTEQRKLAKLHEEIGQLIAEKRELLAKLEHAVNDARACQEQAAQSDAKVGLVNSSLEAREEELEQLRSDLEEAVRSADEKDDEISELREKVEEAEESVDEKIEELDYIRSEVEQLGDALHQKEEELAQIGADLQTVTEKEAALVELRQKVQMLEADKEQLARTAKADQDRLLQPKDDLPANDLQLVKLQDQLDQLDKEPEPLPSQRVNWLVSPTQLIKVPEASPKEAKAGLAAEWDKEEKYVVPELKTSSSQAKIWWSHPEKDQVDVAERVEDLYCTHHETSEGKDEDTKQLASEGANKDEDAQLASQAPDAPAVEEVAIKKADHPQEDPTALQDDMSASSQQVAELVDFVGRVEGMDFVLTGADEDEPISAKGTAQPEVSAKEDTAVEERVAYLRVKGFGFPELAVDWDSAKPMAEKPLAAQDTEPAAKHVKHALKEQPVEAPEGPDGDSMQSFAVDVELEEDDQNMPVYLEPASAPVPPLLAKPQHKPINAEEETFLVGIEMGEEDDTLVEEPAAGADAGKAPEIDQAVAAAAAETRSQLLQAMRAVRDVKELDACAQCGRVHQGPPTKDTWARKYTGPYSRCHHKDGPIQAVAAREAVDELQVDQAPAEAGSEFSVDIDLEEGAKPVVATEGDFELLVTDGSEDAFEIDVEAYNETQDEVWDQGDEVDSRPGSYRTMNKARKSRSKKRSR